MDTDLVNLLKNTGFTQKEAQIYLALLELGQGDVTDIAKKSGLKRPIIYVILEELIEKGYATELPNRKINTFQAIDPGVIQNSLKTTAKNFSEMLPYLRSLHQKSERRPKFYFFDSKEAILKVYEEINNYDKQFFITSYDKIEKHLPGAVTGWIANYKRGKYNFKGRHLIPESEKELRFAKDFASIKQKVKYLPNAKDLKMDFAVFGNKLVITSFEEKPYAVMIESKNLVESLMPILEIAWASGKELNQ